MSRLEATDEDSPFAGIYEAVTAAFAKNAQVHRPALLSKLEKVFSDLRDGLRGCLDIKEEDGDTLAEIEVARESLIKWLKTAEPQIDQLWDEMQKAKGETPLLRQDEEEVVKDNAN